MKLIAIPTRDSMVDDHFGHCAYYTVGRQLYVYRLPLGIGWF